MNSCELSSECILPTGYAKPNLKTFQNMPSLKVKHLHSERRHLIITTLHYSLVVSSVMSHTSARKQGIALHHNYLVITAHLQSGWYW